MTAHKWLFWLDQYRLPDNRVPLVGYCCELYLDYRHCQSRPVHRLVKDADDGETVIEEHNFNSLYYLEFN